MNVSSSEYIAPEKTTDRPLVGVPGTRCIEVQALQETTGDADNVMHFILCKPWELKKAYEHKEIYEPIQSFKVHVVIT